MPRARNLKPGFFKDAKVVSCSFESRLLFQGLWCLADYKGRLKYVPIEVKMEVFPADDVDVDACVSELSDAGLIKIYRDHSGSTLVQVMNFTKHQNPHLNERQDKDKKPLPCLPGPDECLDDNGEEKPSLEQRVRDATRVLLEYYQSDPADSLFLIPDSLKYMPDSDEPGTSSKAIGIQRFIDDCKARGEDVIPTDDPVFEYADSVGLPHEFLHLCWREFVERHKESGKRQKSWRQTFRNCVRGNWYKLWYIDNAGEYLLGTPGKQAQKKHGEPA